MSQTIKFEVTIIENCRVVMGDIPLREFNMLCHGFSESAIMDIDLASRMGASLVIGEPDDVERLRQCAPISPKRLRETHKAELAGVPADVCHWLSYGERGASSNALCKALFGIPEDAGSRHPLDTADLRRCVLFLDCVPADKLDMQKIAGISDEWAMLVDNWDELMTYYNIEKNGKSATLTYKFLEQLLEARHVSEAVDCDCRP